MGSTTSKRGKRSPLSKKSTTTVDPEMAAQDNPAIAAALDAAPPEATESATEEKESKRKRKPRYCKPGEDKPASGLTETPADWNPETSRLAQGQFKSAEFWFLHCANNHKRRAQEYLAQAEDARKNPDKYVRPTAQRKAALVAKADKLLEALVAALVNSGLTEAEARTQAESM